MIIAIDGPAGSGKSSTAKNVAQKLGFIHLDTGAMYRAITLKALRLDIAYTDDAALEKMVKDTSITFTGSPPNTEVFMDDENVSESIRGNEVTVHVSDYCARSVVRERLVKQQQYIGNEKDCVCEGRDIGTVVFPDAEFKFFMVASVEERAKRRIKDFERLGITKTLDEMIADIENRDQKDSSRSLSPLRKADDAIVVDTSDMSFNEQVLFIINTVNTDAVKARLFQ